ncbi:MAG: GlsB/YeaQ/YmgE family stress response membrane protein [Pseudomonadota bacterium]
MEPMGLLAFLLVGAIAGWLAGKLSKGRGFGLFGNIVVGVIGAVIGGYVFDLLNVNVGGLLGSIVMATIGAGILLFALGLFKKR